MNILAIIPARGGSKGIPMKNIQKLCGKSLIEYTIRSAISSSKINRVIVSTDNARIAQVSKKAGAEVPFLRPKILSKDNSPTTETIKHAINFLQKKYSYEPDIICLLQPTSPIRDLSVIDNSITKLQRTNATSVITVAKIKNHPFASFWYSKGYLKPFRASFAKYYQRQKYPPLYYPTGAVYTFWTKNLKKYNSIYGPRIKPIIINQEDNIDIDTLFDLFIAEMRIRSWNTYSKKFHTTY